MLLPVEIARFTRTEPARLCCSDPHLAAGRRYLLRCPAESGLSSCKTILPAISCPAAAGGTLRVFSPHRNPFFVFCNTEFSISLTPSKSVGSVSDSVLRLFPGTAQKKAKSQTFLYHQRPKYNLNSRTSRSAAVTIDSLSSVLHASVFFVMPRTFYYL